jgi:kinesin family protein C1
MYTNIDEDSSQLSRKEMLQEWKLEKSKQKEQFKGSKGRKNSRSRQKMDKKQKCPSALRRRMNEYDTSFTSMSTSYADENESRVETERDLSFEDYYYQDQRDPDLSIASSTLHTRNDDSDLSMASSTLLMKEISVNETNDFFSEDGTHETESITCHESISYQHINECPQSVAASSQFICDKALSGDSLPEDRCSSYQTFDSISSGDEADCLPSKSKRSHGIKTRTSVAISNEGFADNTNTVESKDEEHSNQAKTWTHEMVDKFFESIHFKNEDVSEQAKIWSHKVVEFFFQMTLLNRVALFLIRFFLARKYHDEPQQQNNELKGCPTHLAEHELKMSKLTRITFEKEVLQERIRKRDELLQKTELDKRRLMKNNHSLKNALSNSVEEWKTAKKEIWRYQETIKELKIFHNQLHAVEREMKKRKARYAKEMKETEMTWKKRASDLEVNLRSMHLAQDEDEVSEAMSFARQAMKDDNVMKQLTTKAASQHKDSIITTLENKLFDTERCRRKMHNIIQELRGNIRVYVRVRPFVRELDSRGSDNSIDTPIEVLPDERVINIIGRYEDYSFEYDKVFGDWVSQSDLFDDLSDFVQSAIDGYDVCVFSYGQTGSGKTHTMQGEGTGDLRGIIPRSVQKILREGHLLQKTWDFHVQASFVEIYNETLKDLLNDMGDSSDDIMHGNDNLSVRKDFGGRVYVEGLTCALIDTKDAQKGMNQLQKILDFAAKNRSVASTKMNEESSRSHAIFRLDIVGQHRDTRATMTGSLHLVDLAGSERLDGSESNRDPKLQKETQSINKSLSALGDVFSALECNASHVPYRNSKL